MISNIDLTKLTSSEQIAGEDEEETKMLKQMLQNAINYLQSFNWCPPIERVYFGCGAGDIVAVFLVHFKKKIRGIDEWLWVVEGDLPPAYLVPDKANDPVSALEVYCHLMEDWVKAVIEGRTLNDVYPVKAVPSHDNANNLLKRLNFIKAQLLPKWRKVWPVI